MWEGERVRSYLLRVQLEDRPGSLGSLAVALGTVGADILSLDVVERGAGTESNWVVDDLVVDSIRPHTGLLEAHRELELIDHVAAAGPRQAKLQMLVDEAPRVLRVGWCTVVEHSAAGPHRIAGSPGAPETQAAATPWLPLGHAAALDATEDWVPRLWRDMDTTLAAAPLGGPCTAMVLGRPGGPHFRASEVARLGYLAGIVATLLR
jgi:hypothetical protein